MDRTPGSTDFRGTDRFRVIRRLGAGAMGAVYEAEDAKSGRRVALKTILHRDVELLYRLKKEFRALADTTHENLIEYYDLVADGDDCFFTMELVDGTDFVSACRPASRLDEALLRAALPGLVRGLDALHAAGKVHRDIKPSNVFVTREGRVVLLDFGLAAETGPGRLDSIDASSVALTGTAEYMAPEMASGGAEPTPAADWYGVGVLLFEALTGRLPFTGSLFTILIDKNRKDAPPPKDVAEGVPDDLSELCRALLSRDPADRPTGRDVIERIAGATAASTSSSERPAPPPASAAAPFAGRAAEIGALLAAFDGVAAGGGAAAAVVLGPSGIGKSTLVREFVERVKARRPDAVVLEGRCYERELVPFRAMDGLIDHLSHHWRKMSAADANALLPREASALPRLFPVLARVPAVAAAPPAHASLDPKELRARSVAALREVFERLADRRPLVLVLDDLQWVDPGTMTLLSDLMRPPNPPRLLLVLSSRQEAAAALERLAGGMEVATTRVDVGPLPVEDAEGLARTLLGDAPKELAARVAKEAEGSPYFLGELARYVQSAGATDVHAVRLEQVLNERIERLGGSSRRLLEVVSIAGEPIDPPVAGAAAAVASNALPREVSGLRAGRLLRAAVGGGDALLEPYHDRIKRCVLGLLGDDRRRAHHGSLAKALEGLGTAERLARHWAGAGDVAKAAAYARLAADEALATHHFDHAADLYRSALDLGAPTGEARRTLLLRLGDALQNAGRCAESGEAYLEAAEGAASEEAREGHRKAAEQFLVSGHVAKGLASLATVLGALGETYPKTPRRALASLAWNRLRLKVRGTSWRPRQASDVPPESLARLDAYLSAALGLGLVDNIRGALFQTKALRLALAIGEPRRVGRSFALESVFRASQGTKGRRASRPLVDAAIRLAKETNDPYLAGWVGLAENFARYSGGEFDAAAEGVARTEELFRAETTGTTWEIDTARIFTLQAMRYAGEWGRLSERFDEWLRDARRRGDRYAETTLVRAINGTWLARDDVAGAKAALEAAAWEPPGGAFHIQHWYLLRARAEIALYEGSPVDAFFAEFDRLDRSMLTRVQTIRTESRWLRGRLLLARAAAGAGHPAPPAAEVLRLARLLDADDASYASVWALLLRAGAASAAGDGGAARSTLASAAARAESSHMPLVAAVARHRLGDASGAAWMSAHGVARPDRMASVIAPGI